jgi:hypothetical protein
MNSRTATRQLRHSSIRKWRLWSPRDWASYALLGLVLLPLIGVAYWTYLPLKLSKEVMEASAPRLVTSIINKHIEIPSDSNAYQMTSFRSLTRVNVTFHNKTNESAELYWIGFDGSEKQISTIQAGGYATVETFVGQLWSAKTSNGESLLSYVVES